VPDNDKLRLNSHERVFETYDMSSALRLLVHRIRRADSILRIATNGFDAMETMDPVDFLEFRDYLIPASGFQVRRHSSNFFFSQPPTPPHNLFIFLVFTNERTRDIGWP